MVEDTEQVWLVIVPSEAEQLRIHPCLWLDIGTLGLGLDWVLWDLFWPHRQSAAHAILWVYLEQKCYDESVCVSQQ